MPRTSESLHGNAPESARTVLLLIDTINDFDWPDADRILEEAHTAAKALARLKKRASAAGVPTIYVNDNFGKWRSDFNCQVDHCLRKSQAGHEITRLLKPSKKDYFVLKPRHSGFYSSPLHLLLEHMKAKTLIVGGFTTESCVLITATEAYLRGYRIIVPVDGIASTDRQAQTAALRVMKKTLKAKIVPHETIKF